ncbi:MAG: hypothetical protein V7707_12490 [Motiliproteus sp.]
MNTQSNHRPFWACSCFKKRVLSAGITLTAFLVVVILIGFTAPKAIAANDVAMENLTRAFNPTLVNPPPVDGVSASQNTAALSTYSVAHQNIAMIFDPGLLTAGLNVTGERLYDTAKAGTGEDVAQQNIDRIFSSGSAY